MYLSIRLFGIKGLITVLWMISSAVSAQADIVESTHSEVYSDVLQVEKEVKLMKEHYKITGSNPVAPIEADLKPYHAWQKAYVIQLKLNILRRKHGLSGYAPVSQEPDLHLSPRTGGRWSVY